MKPDSKPFDILECPLEGLHLIEASAGTGKTQAISGLVIRLLLEACLSIERILVVTFTEAAANELRERIRSLIREAEEACVSGRSDIEFLLPLLDRQKDRQAALDVLRSALVKFDLAGISTIHGFCRRVLAEHTFESGVPFDTELNPDLDPLITAVSADFWRNQSRSLSPLFVEYLADRKMDPTGFQRELSPFLSHGEPVFIPAGRGPEFRRLEQQYARAFAGAAEEWNRDPEGISNLLLEDPAWNRNRIRKDKTEECVRRFPILFGPPSIPSLRIGNGPIKALAGGLDQVVKKGFSAPDHPFLGRAASLGQAREALIEVYRRRLPHFRKEWFDFVRENLDRRKGDTNVTSFDDLLRLVDRALGTEGGKVLAKSMRESYGAVLIDEFQDTDPVQYAIFERMFGGSGSKLFFIGDPKQAIYGFRGADVFAYQEASSRVRFRHTLDRNWRSDSGLIDAVNALFSQTDRPFVFDWIPFVPAQRAEKGKAVPLVIDNVVQPGIRVWFLDSPGSRNKDGRLSRTQTVPRIARAVSQEIARLIGLGQEGRACIGDRSVAAKDVAVLVRRNSEARLIQQHLSRMGVHGVLCQTGSVFDSQESKDLALVLAAVADPLRPDLLRTALSTDMGIGDGNLLARWSDEGLDLEKAVVRFRGYHDVWIRQGFIAMFYEWLRGEDVFSRLLSKPWGERRITNLVHLAELLHRFSVAYSWEEDEILQALKNPSQIEEQVRDEQLLRLESDEQAVRIVTIHKSKGLEYPIVFCPFLGFIPERRDSNAPAVFHDPQKPLRLVVDLDPDPESESVRRARVERLAEETRLLYVALTRARQTAFVTWGPFLGGENSSLAVLFHGSDMAGKDTIDAESFTRFKSLTADELRRECLETARRSGGKIVVEDIPDRVVQPLQPEVVPASGLFARTFAGTIDRSRTRASYSSLVWQERIVEPADRDLAETGALVGAKGPDRISALVPAGGPDRAGILSFPKGARTGTFFHDLLEHLDFADPNPSKRIRLAEQKLEEHGFSASEWGSVVHGLVDNVLGCRMDFPTGSWILSSIRSGERLNELEFTFPLKPITPAVLSDVFRRCIGPSVSAGFPERIGRLAFSPSQGFMNGFIDLVFLSGGRYHLVDWKSNFLGPDISDYCRDILGTVMDDAFYTLQAHLYAVALNRYLQLRVPGYSYEDHFGGVTYLFLRGIDPSLGTGSGVYHAMPDASAIRTLSEHLIDADL